MGLLVGLSWVYYWVIIGILYGRLLGINGTTNWPLNGPAIFISLDIY